MLDGMPPFVAFAGVPTGWRQKASWQKKSVQWSCPPSRKPKDELNPRLMGRYAGRPNPKCHLPAWYVS